MKGYELTEEQKMALINGNFNECIIKPGLKAAMDGYLHDFEPAETYNADTDILVTSETIVFELEPVYDAETNEVANYMATSGFRYHFIHSDGISGWILRKKY